jgi:hypothetical protein
VASIKKLSVGVQKAAAHYKGARAGTAAAKASGAPPRPSVKAQTLDDRRAIALGNMRNATAGARNRGSYYAYDPLSSVAAPQAKAVSRGAKRVARASKPPAKKRKG